MNSKYDDFDYTIGVDEVGRGAWAGPIVGAAVAWPTHDLPSIPNAIHIQDSKKLLEHQREEAGAFLRSKFLHSIFGVSPESIMCSGIQEANRRCLQGAMRRIVRQLQGKSYKILIDGRPIYSPGMAPIHFLIKGDAHEEAIAAASIIAKTYRDAYMRRLAKKYSSYAFEKNKGYGTKEHYRAIMKYGTCPIHRKNFEPMKSLTDGIGARV
ncbi:ribonuclease HII [Candidatus Uhrbacteria bacterium]|nr:ribonuclease HII [Candidatus Uhrbacteria bacterium]